MKTPIAMFAGLATGVLLTYLTLTMTGVVDSTSSSQKQQEKKPLYWVAPMDPNYRRDEPGKSPMGMDLIPVYEESSGDGEGPGTISLPPNVVNTLGVRTESAIFRPLHVPVNTVGYVQYDEDKLVHVHPRVAGWVDKLYVKAAGERVDAGQALYTLYSPELVNAQEEYLLAVRRDNTPLIRAARERLSALQVPEELIARLKEQKIITQNVTFYAPQSGVVDNLNIREGFYVKPGTTLMSVGALDEVWVEAEVFERQSAQVRQGLPVTMTLDYLPGRRWQGEVDYVYPTLDTDTRTLRVRLRFDNEDRALRPNMFAQVTIHADKRDSSLLVPTEAVIRTGEQDRVVLALGEGKFKSIEVITGVQTSAFTEILQGLSEGERVVASAQFLLDSESSISSDFKRMSVTDKPSSVWTAGKIESLMSGHRMATIFHEPVDAWQWPSMTMDFIVAEHVDFSALSEGTELHMELTEFPDGQVKVTNIHIMGTDEEPENASATVKGVINSLDSDSRVANISRDSIPKWNRGPAKLDFTVAEGVNMAALAEGAEIRFYFEIVDGDFVIKRLEDQDAVPEEAKSDPHAGHKGH